MLSQALILASQREYAQAMRTGLLRLGDARTQVDLELDALRAMQLAPQNYQLIVIDMVLNAMDGLQLLLLLKHQAPGAKFVIVSDVNDETLRAQAYQNGADLFLLRPGSPQSFQSAVEAIEILLQSSGSEDLPTDAPDEPLVPIIDLVQTHCLSADSVLLQVRSERRSGDIFIYRGEVFHAQYPGRSGEGAFYEIAQWDGGKARIKALKINHLPPRTIEIPYQELLIRVRGANELVPSLRSSTGRLFMVSSEMPIDLPAAVPEAIMEAPPLEQPAETRPAEVVGAPEVPVQGGTPLPTLNAHWKINLMGELVEGSQVSEADRCAFITYFFYRKLADVAVALQVDYFNEMTLWGPHLQQVLVADNLGVRHAVFETLRTDESERDQYVYWCREQSF